MALLRYEHFDLYGTATAALALRGYTVDSGVNISTTAGQSRTGSGCMFTSGVAAGVLRWNLPSARNTVIQGVALQSLTAQGSNNQQSGIFFGTAADANRVQVLLNSTLGFNVFLGGAQVAVSPPNLWVVGSYFWFEVKVTAGEGTGSIVIRVNNEVVFTVNSLSIANITQVGIGKNGSSNNTRFDDWVVCDNTGPDNNDFMGDTFVIVASPIEDVLPNDWVASTGSNRWDMIDELIPLDTDFIRADAVNNVGEFNHSLPNLPPTGTVVAVGVQVRALKTDTSASSIQIGVANGSSHSMSGDIVLGTGAIVRDFIAERNPDGGGLWTNGTALAAKMRLRRTA